MVARPAPLYDGVACRVGTLTLGKAELEAFWAFVRAEVPREACDRCSWPHVHAAMRGMKP